ncbi:MAG: Rne/Rng family ribonuclease [Alphaproteobacteria bacterium]|nr:Rne/Rng family ribonuclease [Alphaproteobacteria bacterium]
MAKRMLVDATHPEETRVAIVDGNRLDDLDFEVANRKMLKGNIYLAKVIRIEPSLQAAFVEYGGNRHGFLAFSEIHPDYYRIPVGDRPEESTADEDDDLAGAPIITEGPGKLAYSDEDSRENEDNSENAEQVTDVSAARDGGAVPQPTWSDEPGSGTVADLIPGFALDNNDSLIRDFSQPVVSEASLLTEGGESAPADEAAQTTETSFETVGGEAADTAPERFVRPRRPHYKIQEVIKRRQVMLVQVVKEERGNKGAALTTYLSLAGRYCVLMPNTAHGGGVSRKITNHQDRRRMKEILDQLEVPEGMALILRTAGMEQEIADIQRDLDYLLRLWNNIREQTLQSSAPALIYEEANLIKRTLRDLYSKEISEILVSGREGYDRARDFMQMMIPDAVDQIRSYEDQTIPLFFRYQVEEQVDALHSPIVQLRSGGYLVINPTEALVSIDVNSGRATRERHIEETALKTNLEAAEEVGRQLRLRDLAGLVVIDFIDMEDGRNNAAVERRLKESMRSDRARLQIGRISHFGLMELSRQRLRPSLLETSFEKCPHCAGLGYVRATDTAALSVLRALEQEGIKNRGGDYRVKLPSKIALYILNNKRAALLNIQQRYGLSASFDADDELPPSTFSLEKAKARSRDDVDGGPAVDLDAIMASSDDTPDEMAFPVHAHTVSESSGVREGGRDGQRRERGGDRGERGGDRGRNRGGRPPRPPRESSPPADTAEAAVQDNEPSASRFGEAGDDNIQAAAGDDQRPRRRGRRGGRRRGGRGEGNERGERATRVENGSAPAEAYAADLQAPIIAHENGAGAVQPQVRDIPRTIHELDTTPKEDRAPRMSAPYEVVNESPDKPKGGWWRRLTGQQ